jgi:two-component system, cell cycle response regulator
MNADTMDQEYLKSLTVLYVEDEDDAREQFSLFLKRLVGALITAKDGAEGLAAYHAHHPHIIITDIRMPNMDGLAMAREIRKSGRREQIVLLTAFEQVDYLKRSINIGVDKYVTKPVNGFQLHKILLECAHSLMAEETLQCAARTDHLTGLANRWELMSRFNSEKGRSERHGIPFTIIIADIDLFKNINDTFGHIAGDRVLKGVSDTITALIRVEDVCGRWGGEEFLLILPNTALDAAVIVAEKLRYAVSELAIEWEDRKIAVTISMGVGAFKPGMGMNECIQPVDSALYHAKNAGRNRVELAMD